MEIEDKLLQGSIDLHAHVYPEFSLRIRGRVNDLGWAELARNAGMRAIVMKSHVFPTVDRARIARMAVPGIEVYGGITLNQSVGGLNPLAVEIAAALGGKIIWMPTWGSRNDLSKSNFFLNRMKAYLKTLDHLFPGPEAGLDILEGGKLKPIMKEIVAIAKEYQMIISSGHLSINESLVLVEECQKNSVPFLLAHPLSRSVGASIADQIEVSKRGGFVEHTFIATMPMHHRLEISKIVEAIDAVGPSQTVLTTDAIQTWNPPPPELMRMYIASLFNLGVAEEAITKMIKENPAKLLGLD
jgi:hypothetical protein